MRYKLKDDLTICQNTYKSAVFNGARILAKEIGYGKFDGVKGEAALTLAKSLVKNQLQSVKDSMEGECEGKDDVVERLEYYMISNMM